MANDFKVIVEGDYAGFNRPELKTERVTYDVPTVGALEGLLKSVYWKPAFNKLFQKPTYTLKDVARKSEKELIIKWLTILK